MTDSMPPAPPGACKHSWLTDWERHERIGRVCWLCGLKEPAPSSLPRPSVSLVGRLREHASRLAVPADTRKLLSDVDAALDTLHGQVETHDYTGDPRHCHRCALEAWVRECKRARAAESELTALRHARDEALQLVECAKQDADLLDELHEADKTVREALLERSTLRKALIALRNDVHAALAANEADLRCAVGNSNVNVLKQRVLEATAVLKEDT